MDDRPDAARPPIPPPPPPPHVAMPTTPPERVLPRPWAPPVEADTEPTDESLGASEGHDEWPAPADGALWSPSWAGEAASVPSGSDGFPLWGPGSLAPLGRRAIARTIDTLLIIVPYGIVAFFMWTHTSSSGEPVAEAVPFWFTAGMQFLAIVYETIALALSGRTLGKWICGLRVENAQGDKPSLSTAATRIAPAAMLGLVPFFGWPLAVVLYTTARSLPMGRHLYDRLAGTVVVSTR